MWTTATDCDKKAAVTAPTTRCSLARRRRVTSKSRGAFHIDGAGRMTSDQKQQGREKLTRLEMILDSKVYPQSLPVTKWNKLRDANDQSFDYFARRYGNPIYCYYRRKWRIQRNEAQDLTMEFITEKLICGRLLEHYRPGQHRFRAYLLQSLRNFLVDSIRKKKLKSIQLDQIIEQSPDAEPCTDDPAEKEFIKDCTHDQLCAALQRVRDECDRDGLEEHFQIFAYRQFTQPQRGWGDIGEEFGVDWQQAKNMAWTIKERLRKAILEEFQFSDMTDQQVKEEIGSLCEDFRGSAGQDFDFPEDGTS